MLSYSESSMEPTEPDFSGEFNPIFIREYVAEIRQRDWKKCCPFKLSGNPEADQVLASLILEDDNALVNYIPEIREAPNSSQEGNDEVHEARSEIPTDNIVADDAADGTINGGTSAEATRRVNDAERQNETNITEDAIVAEKNMAPQDPVINDNAAETIKTPSDSAAGKVKDALCQNEKSSAVDAIAAEIDGQQDTVVGNDAVNAFGDGSSRLVSNELMNNAAQSQNENRVSDEDVIASGNHIPNVGVLNDDGANAMIDGSSEPTALEVSDERGQIESNITEDSIASRKDKRGRNLSLRKPQKFRKVAEIYQELGSSIYGSEGKDACEFTSDDTSEDDDSDEVALGSFIRGKRSVRANSKRIEALKNKRKAAQVSEPRVDKSKRLKSVSEDNPQNDSEIGSMYFLRRNRINVQDLQMTNKHKEFSPEDSLLSRGDKSNRETVQEDVAREVLNPVDENQRRFTDEENCSRPSHGVKRAQHLVQPPIDISTNNVVENVSVRVQKRIRESSPPTDSESMAVLQLLRLSKAEVNTKTPSKTAAEDPTLSVANDKSRSGIDGVVPPALGSMVSEPCVEVNVIDGADLPVNVIDGAGLPQAAQTKSVTFKCPMSRNPAEFSIPNAKKFMRRGKAVKTI